MGIKFTTTSNDQIQKDLLSNTFCCRITNSLETNIFTNTSGVFNGTGYFDYKLGNTATSLLKFWIELGKT